MFSAMMMLQKPFVSPPVCVALCVVVVITGATKASSDAFKCYVYGGWCDTESVWLLLSFCLCLLFVVSVWLYVLFDVCYRCARLDVCVPIIFSSPQCKNNVYSDIIFIIFLVY